MYSGTSGGRNPERATFLVEVNAVAEFLSSFLFFVGCFLTPPENEPSSHLGVGFCLTPCIPG